MSNCASGYAARVQEPDREPSFEEALTMLETLVARLEGGGLPLAEAVEHYEQGMHLAAYCGGLLDGAELRIRQIDAATVAGETLDEGYDPEAPDGAYDLDQEISRLLFDEER